MSEDGTNLCTIPEVIERFRLLMGHKPDSDDLSEISKVSTESNPDLDKCSNSTNEFPVDDDQYVMDFLLLKDRNSGDNIDDSDRILAAGDRKAEKRKAKKKRQREKKKEVKETNNNESVHSDVAGQEKRNSAKQNKNTAPCNSLEMEEEAFLDPNSAFVWGAVGKKKKISSCTVSEGDGARGHGGKREEAEGAIAESERLAIIGYHKASQEQYEQAVSSFTQAIRLVHNDHRFYSNRSFCLLRLHEPARALKDADKAISLEPLNPKAHYRRGEALLQLKQYKLAEAAFQRVLELDDCCEDAQQELDRLHMQQLVEMGFAEDQAFAAVQQYNSVEAAVEDLASRLDTNLAVTQVQTSSGKNSKTDPSNPDGHLSLWVGNVSSAVTDKQLVDLFSKYGVVLSVRHLPDKFCAFVNFRDKTSPGLAMRHLQGYELEGDFLVIRYPNNPVPEAHQHVVIKKPPPGSAKPSTGGKDECHFWRTTGCVFGSKCRFKHVKESRGVERKPWQKSP